MTNKYGRRRFLGNTATLLGGWQLLGMERAFAAPAGMGKRVGIIGLDTSHSVAFAEALNAAAPSVYHEYRVVAAYPPGSLDIESSVSRIPGYVAGMEAMGITIVNSIEELLTRVDVVLLETNDGRRHLEQVIPVLKSGKRVFIDKPLAASLADGIAIVELSRRFRTPVFSASSLRFISTVKEVISGKVGKVLGADAYSPCELEKTHPDFFWYGIHGVELLYAVMGKGCKMVSRTHSPYTDIAVGQWADGRTGTFRGTRTGIHAYGGTVFGEKNNAIIGPEEGYRVLLAEIAGFFQTGMAHVQPDESLEVLAFMEAADLSKQRDGAPVSIEEVYNKALGEAHRILEKQSLV
ncbi:MAG: Gfo/Idh/MocA family oxidoreductase [Flavihumibacter sp.]